MGLHCRHYTAAKGRRRRYNAGDRDVGSRPGWPFLTSTIFMSVSQLVDYLLDTTPEVHWKSFWLVSWEAATACHWSVSILLISRERIVWEAVNIFDIKPWNLFLFQFSFGPDEFGVSPSASCSLFMLLGFSVKTKRAANDLSCYSESKHLNRTNCSTEPEPAPGPGPRRHCFFML